jgi:hypothetical protein
MKIYVRSGVRKEFLHAVEKFWCVHRLYLVVLKIVRGGGGETVYLQ